MKIIIPTLLLLASTASGLSTIQPKNQAPSVVKEIKVSGATDIVSDCKSVDDFCTISWVPKPGKKATFTDHMAARIAIRDELAAIEVKIDEDTATIGELRRAIKLILKLNGLNRR